MSHNTQGNMIRCNEMRATSPVEATLRLHTLAPVHQTLTQQETAQKIAAQQTLSRRTLGLRTLTGRTQTCVGALLPKKRSYAVDWDSLPDNGPYIAPATPPFSYTPQLPPSSSLNAPPLPPSASLGASPLPPLPPPSTFSVSPLPPQSSLGATSPPPPRLPPPSSSFATTAPLAPASSWMHAPTGVVTPAWLSMKTTATAALFSSVAAPSRPMQSTGVAAQLRSYAEPCSSYTGNGGMSGMTLSSTRPSLGELMHREASTEFMDKATAVKSIRESAVAQTNTKTTVPHQRSYANNTCRRPTNSDGFMRAAEAGARTQMDIDAESGTIFDTYLLGRMIVSGSRLYANQRRSNRLLPGGSDSTTAACFMIGGTCDQMLEALLERLSPCDPREERCKAVERMLKNKTRRAICLLNGGHPREGRADNLAAVRICEAVADILVAHRCRKLLESRDELAERAAQLEVSLRIAREEAVQEQRRREAVERECWCKGSAEKPAPSAAVMVTTHASTPEAVVGENGVSAANGAMTTMPQATALAHIMDFHSFEKNKLLLGRGNLSSSGFRSDASAASHSLSEAVEQQDGNKYCCP